MRHKRACEKLYKTVRKLHEESQAVLQSKDRLSLDKFISKLEALQSKIRVCFSKIEAEQKKWDGVNGDSSDAKVLLSANSQEAVYKKHVRKLEELKKVNTDFLLGCKFSKHKDLKKMVGKVKNFRVVIKKRLRAITVEKRNAKRKAGNPKDVLGEITFIEGLLDKAKNIYKEAEKEARSFGRIKCLPKKGVEYSLQRKLGGLRARYTLSTQLGAVAEKLSKMEALQFNSLEEIKENARLLEKEIENIHAILDDLDSDAKKSSRTSEFKKPKRRLVSIERLCDEAKMVLCLEETYSLYLEKKKPDNYVQILLKNMESIREAKKSQKGKARIALGNEHYSRLKASEDLFKQDIETKLDGNCCRAELLLSKFEEEIFSRKKMDLPKAKYAISAVEKTKKEVKEQLDNAEASLKIHGEYLKKEHREKGKLSVKRLSKRLEACIRKVQEVKKQVEKVEADKAHVDVAKDVCVSVERKVKEIKAQIFGGTEYEDAQIKKDIESAKMAVKEAAELVSVVKAPSLFNLNECGSAVYVTVKAFKGQAAEIVLRLESLNQAIINLPKIKPLKNKIMVDRSKMDKLLRSLEVREDFGSSGDLEIFKKVGAALSDIKESELAMKELLVPAGEVESKYLQDLARNISGYACRFECVKSKRKNELKAKSKAIFKKLSDVENEIEKASKAKEEAQTIKDLLATLKESEKSAKVPLDNAKKEASAFFSTDSKEGKAVTKQEEAFKNLEADMVEIEEDQKNLVDLRAFRDKAADKINAAKEVRDDKEKEMRALPDHFAKASGFLSGPKWEVAEGKCSWESRDKSAVAVKNEYKAVLGERCSLNKDLKELEPVVKDQMEIMRLEVLIAESNKKLKKPQEKLDALIKQVEARGFEKISSEEIDSIVEEAKQFESEASKIYQAFKEEFKKSSLIRKEGKLHEKICFGHKTILGEKRDLKREYSELLNTDDLKEELETISRINVFLEAARGGIKTSAELLPENGIVSNDGERFRLRLRDQAIINLHSANEEIDGSAARKRDVSLDEHAAAGVGDHKYLKQTKYAMEVARINLTVWFADAFALLRRTSSHKGVDIMSLELDYNNADMLYMQKMLDVAKPRLRMAERIFGKLKSSVASEREQLEKLQSYCEKLEKHIKARKAHIKARKALDLKVDEKFRRKRKFLGIKSADSENMRTLAKLKLSNRELSGLFLVACYARKNKPGKEQKPGGGVLAKLFGIMASDFGKQSTCSKSERITAFQSSLPRFLEETKEKISKKDRRLLLKYDKEAAKANFAYKCKDFSEIFSKYMPKNPAKQSKVMYWVIAYLKGDKSPDPFSEEEFPDRERYKLLELVIAKIKEGGIRSSKSCLRTLKKIKAEYERRIEGEKLPDELEILDALLKQFSDDSVDANKTIFGIIGDTYRSVRERNSSAQKRNSNDEDSGVGLQSDEEGGANEKVRANEEIIKITSSM